MRAPQILLVSGSLDGALPFQRLLTSRLPGPPILATQDLAECLRSPSPGPFDLCVVATLGATALGAQACRQLRERQGHLGPPIVLLVEEAADLEALGIGLPEGVEVLPVPEEGGPLLGSALRSLLRARFAEEALRRGEQAAGLGSWTLNVRKDQMEWSQGMYRILGRASDDPVTSFSQFLELSVHPDDRAEAALRAEAADDAEELEPFVCQIVRPDGSLRRVWIQGGERVREQDGSLRFVTGIAQDITEQREVEEQLLRQNALLAAIFDSAPYAMITVDPSGRVLSTNQMGALFSELPTGQNIGVMCGDFIRCRHAPFGPGCGQNPECPDCPIRGALNRALQSGKPVQGVEATLHVVRGGQPVPLEVVVSASPIAAGPDPQVLLTFSDVTQRRRAERALAVSEERYRRIVETAHEGILALDAGGRITFASHRMADMLACAPDDLVGQSLGDLIDGDVGAEPLPIGQTALADETQAFECLLRRKTGGRASVVVSTAPWQDASGAFSGATLFVADITEHRQSEERFRRAFEAGSVIMFVTSNEHDRIVDANEALLKHLGLPRERVVGRAPLELGLVPDPGSKHRAERALSADGRLRNMAVQYRDRSGDPRTLLISVDRIHVGDEPCWLTSAVDITEREEAVKALRESEELYAKAFAASPDAVSLMAIPSGELLAVNEGFVSLFGYTKEELLGRTDEQLGLWWSPEGRDAAHERLSRDGQLHNLEVLCRSKDGSQLPCSLSAEKVVLGGRTCLLSYLHDLTEQQRAESERLRLVEQLQQAAKMEAVGRLAGGVAHDFNNLLTPILGYSEMLTEMLQPGTSEHHHAAEIAAMGERAAALTRQLLAFSRKQVLRAMVVDLNQILKGLAKMLRRLIDEDVRIEWLLADNLGSVLADPGQLEQVIVNLAVNARDAMPGGGVLTIRTCSRHLGQAQAAALGLEGGNCVQLEVSDTGTGMDAETQSRIFEPFFTTKAMGRGTGLGLSTVYGIVGQSGGTIQVESQADHGTTFRILLPEAATPVEQPSVPIQESAGGYETLLVAEDDETVRALLERVLVAAGYTVLTAATGDQALRLARSHSGPIHLLLSDVVMPGLHGQGLASELAAIRPETRVLLMSGYSSAPSRDSLTSLMESPFLEKPFRPHEVCRKVREVLDAEPGGNGEGTNQSK